MKRVEGPRTPYEVYCYQCRVTFPSEARRCVHCGNRLGSPGRNLGLEMTSSAPSEQRPADDAEAASPAEEVEDGGSLLLRRFGGLALWAILALAAVISNMCQGPPGSG